MISHVLQPTPRTCGQAVCAMITGIDVGDIITTMGDTGTRWPDLRAFLRTHGHYMLRPSRYNPRRTVLDGTTVCRIDWGAARIFTHWILWHDGRFWDPGDMSSHSWRLNGGTIYSHARVF